MPVSNGKKSEFVVKGSKFIGQAFFIKNREKSKEILAKLWQKHPQATHIVYAFKTGGLKKDIYGASDDGEPAKTAGKPVLQVLKGANITNVILTVIRYYGGTKLGTGGLVKCYTQSAKDQISLLKTKKLIPLKTVELNIEYSKYELLKKSIAENKGEIIEEKFTDKVYIKFLIQKKWGRSVDFS
ncbi:MAG: IMPACT family protein [Candidatus Muiribacteriota bacterium]